MTAQATKRKRYEGVSQFQDPLRQALVCLQAALAGRFASAVQLDFLKQKDTDESSHFILASDNKAIAPDLTKLEAQHLMLRIIQREKLDQGFVPCPDSKISAWVDPVDSLTAQYLCQLLGQAANGPSQFCLKRALPWGSMIWSWETVQQAPPLWLCETRRSLLVAFYRDATALFQKLESVSLISDGCLVALVIEGKAKNPWEPTSKKALETLPSGERHLVTVSGGNQKNKSLQCAYLAPLRLPEKELQSSTLKGVLLLRDIKEAVKLTSSMLAS